MKYTPVLPAALAALLVLGGCASVSAPATPEAAVQARSQQRLKLLEAQKFDDAYEYLAPSYRAITDRKAYRRTFGGGASWVNPEATKVECPDDKRCKVTVELGVRVAAPGFSSQPVPSTIWETWVKEDGQWWFFRNN